MECRLQQMFELRKTFIEQMRNEIPDSYPDKLPVDLTEKSSQKFCRDLAFSGIQEMFEALDHLKNWKPHRRTEIKDIDKDEFLEEFVDAINYFFAMLIVAGFDEKDLFDMYKMKDAIIRERLRNGY